MRKFNAVLVEDEVTAGERTLDALNKAGFDVLWHKDAESALAEDEHSRLIDLIVVDRKLPQIEGEEASNQIGDELLTLLLERHTDVPIVIFSGYTGIEHMQFATGNRGAILLRNGTVNIDRARVFEKGQSLEFDSHVAAVRDLLESLEDIEVLYDKTPSDLDRRILRRVAFEYGGSSVNARALGGGFSGAAVWLCEVWRDDSLHARVVVKRQRRRLEPGGFQSLCEAKLVAGTTATLSGFCSGFFCGLQQIAANSPASLMELIVSSPHEAATSLTKLRSSLDTIGQGSTGQATISDIGAPYAAWTQVERTGDFLGRRVPAGSRLASSRRAAQHGDLHPGNVLVSEGQPVLIDFDNQTFGSPLLDPISLLLGPLFHEDSELRLGEWPSVGQLVDFLGEDFLAGCPAPDYFAAAADWIRSRTTSERELSAVVLAYASRQLKYDDVVSSPVTRARAIALANWAVLAIEAS